MKSRRRTRLGSLGSLLAGGLENQVSAAKGYMGKSHLKTLITGFLKGIVRILSSPIELTIEPVEAKMRDRMNHSSEPFDSGLPQARYRSITQGAKNGKTLRVNWEFGEDHESASTYSNLVSGVQFELNQYHYQSNEHR